MLDLGVNGLDDGSPIALDLCISDCGSGAPPISYKTGAKCTSMGKQKKQKYIARFPGISASELCCPSYGATGCKNADAIELHQHIVNALAAANPTIPRSRLACRVSQVVSVAIQRVVAYNALDFRYTKLKDRVVGSGALYEGVAGSTCTGGDDWDEDVPAEDPVPAQIAAPSAAVEAEVPELEGQGQFLGDDASLMILVA